MNDTQQLELVHRFSDLLHKYIFQAISDDELTALYSWAHTRPANKELFEELSDPVALSATFRSFLEIGNGPAGSDPAGSNPAGSDPAGSDPAEPGELIRDQGPGSFCSSDFVFS